MNEKNGILRDEVGRFQWEESVMKEKRRICLVNSKF